NVQSLAVDLEKHVFGRHPLGRTRVMGATRSVDVMVAAVESVVHRMNPPLELHFEFRHSARWNRNVASKLPIFRTAIVLHREAAWRQHNSVTIAPINLRLKIKIRGEPLGLRREHMTSLVAKNQPRRSGLPVVVPNMEPHLDGRSNV